MLDITNDIKYMQKQNQGNFAWKYAQLAYYIRSNAHYRKKKQFERKHVTKFHDNTQRLVSSYKHIYIGIDKFFVGALLHYNSSRC